MQLKIFCIVFCETCLSHCCSLLLQVVLAIFFVYCICVFAECDGHNHYTHHDEESKSKTFDDSIIRTHLKLLPEEMLRISFGCAADSYWLPFHYPQYSKVDSSLLFKVSMHLDSIRRTNFGVPNLKHQLEAFN